MCIRDSPSTSFDCSGFVSYVLTNSGLCNTGRLGAQGLYNISTPVSKMCIRDSLPAARARFARIETDTLNRFKVMGAAAHVLDGKERLELLHGILHPCLLYTSCIAGIFPRKCWRGV